MHMRINLPNQITIARLILGVIFFVCLGQFDVKAPAYWLLDLSFVLFVVAVLSDILDGYLARKHNEITSLGRILDPFVDKMVVIGAYAFLAGAGFVDAQGHKVTDVAMWMVVVILGRELLVTSFRGFTEAGGQAFGANVYGKTKMFLQSFTVGTILVTVAHPGGFVGGPVGQTVRIILVYATVVFTLLSLIPYIWMARHVLSHTSVSTS